MQFVGKTVLGCAVTAAIAATACTAEETATTGNAPEVAVDGLDESDFGDSYNGWTQYLSYSADLCRIQPDVMAHGLGRDYGDNTRGGGACAVRGGASGCSDDSPCIAEAQAWYGPSAYGYCYANSCYLRPGSQVDWCVMSPNRGAGSVLSLSFGSIAYDAIGCMTKNAGPNTACGGTNASLYMRTWTTTSYYYSDNCP
jgi:hypothetical protein